MSNINTLFRKGYLLAGVLMAANMLAVNEVKASAEEDNRISLSEKIMIPTNNEINNDNNIKKNNETEVNDKKKEEEKKGEGDHKKKQGPLDKLLSLENYINLFGTLALSGANSYFKWWGYNPGGYLSLRIGCLGWRTKKFFDTVQLDFNLNLGRGALWTILDFISLCFRGEQKTVAMYVEHKAKLNKLTKEARLAAYFFITFLQGLISAPLTVHIAKFDFSISLSIDSIIWEIVRQVCWKKHHSEEDIVNLEESYIFFHDRGQTNSEK